MKKILLLLCVITLVLGVIPANAYKFPHEFWAVNDAYERAVNTNDYANIINYGNQAIEIVLKTEDAQEKINVLLSRYTKVAESYAMLEDYENSALTYRKLYELTSRLGTEYDDYTKGAKARILQYMPEITMYTDRGTSTYYGAKNEKPNGVLFGICSNGQTRELLPNESMVLTYQEFGKPLLAHNIDVFNKAAESDLAVEFALNCPGEGWDIKNIGNMESSLYEISEFLKGYPNTPVYLRFGAEFDVWTNPTEPEEFKNAFRYVSDYFKSRNPNVAIVWSPNQVAGWNTNVDDFYPGDEYVDWVGLSLYSQKYFQGDKNRTEMEQIFFRTGINSNPVLAVRHFVETYGDRKPIMISESGFSHKLFTDGEDTTDFALQRMKEFYCYLPMVYPQIKLVAHFDWYVESSGEKNDFRLSTNGALQTEYLSLVKGERFIQNGFNNGTDYCNRPVYNGMNLDSVFELSCYAHMYNTKLANVTYFIDDNYVGMSAEIPYTTYIDANGYAGVHRLKAIAQFENGKTLATESNVNFADAGQPVSVEVDGSKIEFDQPPVIYNSRTMVPMRKIFEALGAEVSWDGNTRTAKGTRGALSVEITVGMKKMYVNGREVELDVAPILLGGRTLVPARAVAEGLGCMVGWDGDARLVSITDK